jgi:hypothetical protein
VIETELQHDGLEIAARDCVPVISVVSQKRRERSTARTARVCVEDAKDGTEVEQFGLLGALNRAAQVMRRDDCCEVEQRARERRRRDPAFDCPFVAREVGRAMEEPPWALLDASTTGQRELDECAAPRPDAPHSRCAPMAHGRFVAVSEDDTQHVPLTPQLDMAEGVDPRLDLHQPPTSQPMVDRILTEAEAQQLLARDHPVLARP